MFTAFRGEKMVTSAMAGTFRHQFLTEAPNLSALMPIGSSPLPKAQHNTGIRDCVLIKGQRGE